MPPYERALREIFASPANTAEDIEDKAVACNLLCDERVGRAREDELFQFSDGVLPRPVTGQGIKTSVKVLFEKRVRTAAVPDYVRPALNRHNFVPVASGLNPSGLNPTLTLVSILDLTGLHKVYLFAQENGLSGFEDYREGPGRAGVFKFVEQHMGRSETEARAFVGLVLNAIYERSKVAPFGPVWALWWDEFEPYINENAERWLELLGKLNRHSFDMPHWLIPLRYSLSALGQVARPTQIDADWFPFHFPSPPMNDAKRGGHPMDRSMPPSHTVPLTEFIHQQIRLQSTAWTGTQKVTSSRVSGDLIRQRKAHYARLLHFNNNLTMYGWIGACV